MRYLRKFVGLSPAERWLVIKAALLLGSTKLGLKLLPFRLLRRLTDSLSRPTAWVPAPDRFSAEKIAWAVELVGRYVPSTCLSRALSAQVLLARRGYPVLLHFGVVKEGERFLAHAWLESEGQVVVGGYALEPYMPLGTLAGNSPYS
jgi:Transglutaminase-like superfamily